MRILEYMVCKEEEDDISYIGGRGRKRYALSDVQVQFTIWFVKFSIEPSRVITKVPSNVHIR